MDYRFNPSMSAPRWYTPVSARRNAKMWAEDRRQDEELAELLNRDRS